VIKLNQNSNIRRIDELGRVVIPKDIRKKLHIKDNEPLEIFISNDEIHIKKYSSIDDITVYIKYLVDMFNRITQNKYIVTNRESIIASTEQKFNGIELNKCIENLLHSEKQIKSEYKEILLNDSILIKAFINTVPIIIDNDRSGLIIEYNTNDKLLNTDIVNIFKNILEEKLNNY